MSLPGMVSIDEGRNANVTFNGALKWNWRAFRVVRPRPTRARTRAPRRRPSVARVEASKDPPAPRRTFERGDHVEMATALIEVLEAQGPVVRDERGQFCRIRPSGRLEPIPGYVMSRIVMSLAGWRVGERGVLRVNARDVDGAIALAGDRVPRVERGLRITDVAWKRSLIRKGKEQKVAPCLANAITMLLNEPAWAGVAARCTNLVPHGNPLA